MSRVKKLLEELAATLTEQKVPGCTPATEPDVEFVVEVHSTWDKFASTIYEILLSADMVGEYQGPNGEYCYLINISPYAASMIFLKWWGPKKHKRLTELKRTIRDVIKRAEEIFWEDITASRIRKELDIIRAEAVERAAEPFKKLLEFYRDKVPLRVFRELANNDIDYIPETSTIIVNLTSDAAKHIIGKGGAKVKSFTEATGYKLDIRPVDQT